MSDEPLLMSEDGVILEPAKNPRMPYGMQAAKRRIKSGVCSFTLGRWPRGSGRVSREVSLYRELLEKWVTNQRGEVTEGDASSIQSACRHEAISQLYQRWLRLEFEKMSYFERAGYLSKIGEHTDKRDNCLKKLGFFERNATDPWEEMKRIQAKSDATTEQLREAVEGSEPEEGEDNEDA